MHIYGFSAGGDWSTNSSIILTRLSIWIKWQMQMQLKKILDIWLLLWNCTVDNFTRKHVFCISCKQGRVVVTTAKNIILEQWDAQAVCRWLSFNQTQEQKLSCLVYLTFMSLVCTKLLLHAIKLPFLRNWDVILISIWKWSYSAILCTHNWHYYSITRYFWVNMPRVIFYVSLTKESPNSWV